jgi:carboxymethylenebutenolidase
MATMRIAATDGSGDFDAWLVAPKAQPAGAVVLIQEIFGVNASLKETAAGVAELGFFVLAPDLFWRQERNVDISDKSEAEWNKAFALMNGFDHEKGMADLKATLAVARQLKGANGKAGTMGYCLGGMLAFRMALESDADVNVSYYGVALDKFVGGLDKVKAPLVLHIADEDEFFPPEGRAKVVAAAQGHPHVRTYTYPGANHAFARTGGIHWHARSATIANGRSAEALAAALDR